MNIAERTLALGIRKIVHAVRHYADFDACPRGMKLSSGRSCCMSGIAFGVLGDLFSDTAHGGWTMAVVILVYNFAILAYFALSEGLADGRTPGKRAGM